MSFFIWSCMILIWSFLVIWDKKTWFRLKIRPKDQKGIKTEKLWDGTLIRHPYNEWYFSLGRPQIHLKLILDKTRLQDQSKDINYKILDMKWISYDFYNYGAEIHLLSWPICVVKDITRPIQLQIECNWFC